MFHLKLHGFFRFQGCGLCCICCMNFWPYSQDMLLMLVFADEQVIILYWLSKKDRGSDCCRTSKFVDKSVAWT